MDSQAMLRRMMSLCARSEHCESQVRQKLRVAGVDADEADDIVAQLRHDGYIDDDRYARAFASDRLRFAHWGRVKIACALRAAALPERSICMALDALDDDEYRRVLRQTVEAKARTLGDMDERARWHRIMAFAAQRGFTPDEVSGCALHQCAGR